jgi:hypothetical protein
MFFHIHGDVFLKYISIKSDTVRAYLIAHCLFDI